MPSEVYFSKAQMRKLESAESLPNKVPVLMEKAGVKNIIKEGEMVAIKIHLGRIGGYRSIRPSFVRKVVDVVRSLGGRPFVTDTWGLVHLDDAVYNGYTYATINAPVIPTNGIKENDFRTVKIDGLQLKEVKVAGNLYDADVLVNFAHAKGHGSSGFGGLIKNLAIGGTVKEIRRREHSLEREEEGARKFQEAMADVVKAVLENKWGKAIHMSYIMDVTEHCDCPPWSTTPIVPDIGLAVSQDIVALERATLDLINEAPAIPYSIAEKYEFKPGENKFLKIHGRDPYIQVRAAEKLGLGSSDYRLIEV